MIRKLAMLVAVAALSLAAVSTVGAARTGAAVCKSFKLGGKTYQSETLGAPWTCKSAKAWIVKLHRDRVPRTVTKNVRLNNGPSGYHCFATPFSSGGRATAGTCIKGTIAYPRTGFAWMSNP
jgi:hypothetical protein